MRIGCEINSKLCVVIKENMKYWNKLNGLYLCSKDENKISNHHFGDVWCIAIFYSKKYLTDLEILILGCNKELNENSLWNNIQVSK